MNRDEFVWFTIQNFSFTQSTLSEVKIPKIPTRLKNFNSELHQSGLCQGWSVNFRSPPTREMTFQTYWTTNSIWNTFSQRLLWANCINRHLASSCLYFKCHFPQKLFLANSINRHLTSSCISSVVVREIIHFIVFHGCVTDTELETKQKQSKWKFSEWKRCSWHQHCPWSSPPSQFSISGFRLSMLQKRD